MWLRNATIQCALGQWMNGKPFLWYATGQKLCLCEKKLCLCDSENLTGKKNNHFIENNSNFMLLEKETMTVIIKVVILGKLNCR